MDLMGNIVKISKSIKEKEPPVFTAHQKQAAIALIELEKVITDLIMEKMSLKIIFLSLFYFWIMLEAPLRNVREREIEQWSMPLDEAISQVIEVIKSTIGGLPDCEPTMEMQSLGESINELKTSISDEQIDPNLLPTELIQQSEQVNTRIHSGISNLLGKEFHPEIVSNVIFGYWLRISTLNAHIFEEFYQKMEYYFGEVIEAARKKVPLLFLR